MTKENDYTIITRVRRCQRWLAELEDAAENRRFSDRDRETFRVGIINVERKLREVVEEVVGSTDGEGKHNREA